MHKQHCGTLDVTTVPCKQMLQSREPTDKLHDVSDSVFVHDGIHTRFPITHSTTHQLHLGVHLTTAHGAALPSIVPDPQVGCQQLTGVGLFV
jgi:hypothetical protein